MATQGVPSPHKPPTADEKWQGMPSDLWNEAHRVNDGDRDDMWDWLEDRYWNLVEQYEASQKALKEIVGMFYFEQAAADSWEDNGGHVGIARHDRAVVQGLGMARDIAEAALSNPATSSEGVDAVVGDSPNAPCPTGQTPSGESSPATQLGSSPSRSNSEGASVGASNPASEITGDGSGVALPTIVEGFGPLRTWNPSGGAGASSPASSSGDAAGAEDSSPAKRPT